MTEPKWTPGPWRIMRYSETGVEDHAGRLVASTGGRQSNVKDERPENVANAHLIAAAPDLYEALEAVMAHLRGEAGYSTAHHKARAALAKARGESDG